MKLKPLKENKNIFIDDKGRLYTKNLVKGQKVYTEKVFKYNNEEYREWVLKKSKLSASIKKNIGLVPINEGDRVLYLGIAAGTTASHISDIIGNDGMIFGIDIAPRILRELVPIIYKRDNIIGLLNDSDKPDSYLHIVPKVDIVYQDVAQPHQIKIFLENIDYYLKNRGYGFLAVKARSINVAKDPKEIFKDVRKSLEDHSLNILKEVRLEPYHKDHAMFLIENK
ncbi:fibrillarin-like rRNA methylase [Nanobdella aerobiophila]|uniref:Fibrillarin-like rRNA/tRNA 2'-O-methyltransferase n=1 Tax=Nanobdella aerobiophila TaxID=2586965 RepID=A0A915SHT1_9ARCH|nr:fibrillarin-like rRNA/tRNA 2'-O-methyltransferase [Nanobdella aerobiophila]BBL45212.1 fibrillarin-like rRNA methylase [Nanobdella aerobiophila]